MALLRGAEGTIMAAGEDGVSKTGVCVRARGVSGMPLVGRERIGGGVWVRSGCWVVGDRAARRALRVLIAEAWMRCLREAERVVLMLFWPG